MKTNSSPKPNPYAKRFEEISARWLEESCELFPEFGSGLGFRKFDARLGTNTPEVHRRHIALMEETLAALEELPEAAFAGDAWIDRRGMLALLRSGLLAKRDLARWRTDPQQHPGTAIGSVFELVVRGADNLRGVLPAIESRLASIPAHLAAGLECVKSPEPLWTGLAEKSCQGAVEFLEALEPELAPVSTNPVRWKSLVSSAASAFRDYAKGIRRKKQGRPGGFAIGRQRFEYLVREELGLDLSLPEIKALGEYQVQRHEHLLAVAARRHGAKRARDFLENSAASWNPGKPLLEIYRETTGHLHDRLRKLGLVTLPEGDTLKVLPVPPFLRHQFPTAAYSAPEPFARKQTGIFWVNDLSLATSDPAKQLAEIRQHHGLELTSVHEGYPGHHLQFVVQFRHPSKWRRLFSHAIFYEGWTMWCEKMAVEHGLVDMPGAEILQLHDSLWRAHRIVIDCGLQEGSLSHSAAARRLQKGVGFTAARARADVNWYTSSPTVPMSYLAGRLEVEKLHARLVCGGGWTLRRFNDWMLSHGAVPYDWITRQA